MKPSRPRQFWDDYASRFKNRSVAENYKFRPPYPAETYHIILDLLDDENKRILDVGCGTGKIARNIQEKRTAPICYTQTVQDYIQSFHSRASLSKEDMGEKNVREFDTKLDKILSHYTDDNGNLTYKLQTKVSWGKVI